MASRTQYELEILLGARKASSYDKSIKSAKDGFGTVSSTAKKAAAAVTAAFAAVNITSAITDAVEVYAGFEQSMANTAAIAGATATEYNLLEDAAREAGKATSKTAQESADALGYMALAGWNVSDSIDSLMPVLKLSESTQLDLARTSDLVTDSMSAMGIPISELSGYLDMVVKANNSANTTAEQAMETFIRTGGAANALGVELEETATAAGILANNGTKGTKSGTALNAIFSRIATNDKAKDALKELGVSVFDAQGEFVGLENVLIDANEALDKLSTKEATAYMKDISGTQYYSRFKYLLDSVEEGANGAESAWTSLEDKLRNSDGALDVMNEKVMDTMQGAQARLTSAVDDMKISFADSFDGELIEGMELLTEVFNDVSESIQTFSEENAVEIHQVFEDIVAGVETTADVLGDVAGFVVENWSAVEAVVVGGGAAVAFDSVAGSLLGVVNAVKAVKAAKATGTMASLTGGAATLGSLLSPTGLAVAGITAGVAAITGAIVYYNKTKEEMIEDGLAEHFGEINFSLEQLDEIAQDIVGKKKLTQISAMLGSIADTEDAIASMTDSFEEIQKVRWKIDAGLEITTDDKDTYIASVKQYMEDAQNAISSQGYTVSVATKLLLGNESSLESENNAFYAGLDSELAGLQKKLNKKIQKAVENGVDIDTDKSIQRLLGKVNDITTAVTDAQNKATLQSIQLKYSGKDMTSDNFKQLMDDISKYEGQIVEGAQEAYETSMATLNTRLSQGDISEKKYNKKKSEYEAGYYQTQADAMSDSYQFLIDTVGDAYGSEVSDAMDSLQKDIDVKLKESMDSGVDVLALDETFRAIVQNTLNSYNIDEDTQDQIAKLFDSGLGEQLSKMEALSSQMKENDIVIPESFSDKVLGIESLSAISGNIDSGLSVLGDSISESPEYTAILNVGKEMGEEFSESIADGISNASSQVMGATHQLLMQIQNGTSTYVNTSVASESLLKGSPSGKKGSKTTTVKDQNGSVHTIYRNAKGGIYDSPIFTTFAEKGAEAAIPLDGSERSKAILNRTNQIMGMTVVEDKSQYPSVPTLTRDVALSRMFSSSQNKRGAVAGNGSSIQITYSPVIHVAGNADQNVIERALKIGKEEFAKMAENYFGDKNRVSFAGD